MMDDLVLFSSLVAVVDVGADALMLTNRSIFCDRPVGGTTRMHTPDNDSQRPPPLPGVRESRRNLPASCINDGTVSRDTRCPTETHMARTAIISHTYTSIPSVSATEQHFKSAHLFR